MADSSSLVSALLRQARGMGAVSGKVWLQGEHKKALDAVLEGDEEVTSLSYEGGSQSTRSRISAQDLLEALNDALDQFEGVDSDSSGMIIPQFSCIPR